MVCGKLGAVLTKAEARRRAKARHDLDDAISGYIERPREWWQSIANRFPDLWAAAQDEHLGRDEAVKLRLLNARQNAPKVGDEIEIDNGKAGRRHFKGNVLVSSVGKDGSIAIAKDNRSNRIALRIKRVALKLKELVT